MGLMALCALSCGDDGKDEEQLFAMIVSDSFVFDETDPAANTVQVVSNTSWQVTYTPSDVFVKAEPFTGSGNGSFRIVEMPQGMTIQVNVRTATGGTMGEAITVTRAAGENPDPDPDPTPVKEIFVLDFGTTAVTWADRDDAWKTQRGEGAAGVGYETINVSVRSDNYGSAGRYSGASGGAYARMYKEAGNYFVINDIELPAGVRDFTFGFGSSFVAEDVALAVQSGGSAWCELTYSASSAYNTWQASSVGFTLKEPVGKINIRFMVRSNGADRTYGHNFDDLRLVTGGGGQTVDLSSGPGGDYRFPELPANWAAPTGNAANISNDLAFFTRWSKSVSSKKTVRNYSYCYDTRRHNPVWVAYPLHAVYREGGTGRTNPDPWAPDPAFDEAFQSKIYKHDGEGDGIYDGYQFWGVELLKSLGKGGYWSKGHLCMSSERGGKDTELNMQTFYPTNIAPQSSAAASDFAEVWSYVESLFSGTNDYKNTDFTADDGSQNLNIVADTLYLVAGCYYEHDDWVDYDASNSDYTSTTSSLSKKCIMPTHQFKMALRTKKGNTGKRITDCSADELQAIAFWIEAFPTLSGTSATAELNRIAVPVSFVEEKMGFEFFPGVPASVKASFNAADWGF